MTSIILNIKNHFSSLNIIEKLLVSFPLFAIMGSLVINIFYLIVVILFLAKIKEIKFHSNFQKKLITYIIFTYLIILTSYLFSDYKNTSSLIRSISMKRSATRGKVSLIIHACSFFS